MSPTSGCGVSADANAPAGDGTAAKRKTLALSTLARKPRSQDVHGQGLEPRTRAKEIARALRVPPAKIAPLVRLIPSGAGGSRSAAPSLPAPTAETGPDPTGLRAWRLSWRGPSSVNWTFWTN